MLKRLLDNKMFILLGLYKLKYLFLQFNMS